MYNNERTVHCATRARNRNFPVMWFHENENNIGVNRLRFVWDHGKIHERRVCVF